MSKINKATIYAIKWLFSQGKTPKQISDELKISVKQVSSHIEENTNEISENSNQAPINPKKLMITHTSGKKINNVAIMTGEASMLSDHFKKNQKEIENKNIKGIYRPKND